MKETVEKLDNDLYNSFWKELQQLKYDINYFDEHFKRCVNISRLLKYIIVGITSLTTGAWLNWDNISAIHIICPIVILISQGVSAISDFMPFEKRKIELRELSEELSKLYIEMENDWRKVQAVEVNNDQLKLMIYDYSSKEDYICNHYLKDDVLPVKENIRKAADDLTEEYFLYKEL